MYKHIGIDADAFALKVKEIRKYRDNLVAHLDSDLVAHIPLLDGPAEAALRFYREHLVTNEARAGYLVGLTGASDELVRGYDQCLAEATAVFRHQTAPSARCLNSYELGTSMPLRSRPPHQFWTYRAATPPTGR